MKARAARGEDLQEGEIDYIQSRKTCVEDRALRMIDSAGPSWFPSARRARFTHRDRPVSA
jgi:hypothetical protein